MKIKDREYRPFDDTTDLTFGHPENAPDFWNGYASAKKEWESKPLRNNDVYLHVIHLGENITIAATSGEIFVEFGLEVKQKSKAKYTFFFELTGGHSGYIPTRKAFDEGGYEVRKLVNISWLDMGAGEMLVEAFLEDMK